MTSNNTKQDKQKQQLKKYLIFAVMGLAFLGVIWLIFAPSGDKKQVAGQAGFNTEIPEPVNVSIFSNKQSAYEQEQMQIKQNERMKTLDDFVNILGNEEPADKTEDMALIDMNEKPKTPAAKRSTGSSNTHSSASAYRDINKTLGSFYEPPKEDAETKRLKSELEALKAEKEVAAVPDMDQRLQFMEKSLQMANKYLSQGSQSALPITGAGQPGNQATAGSQPANRKSVITPVAGVEKQVVSALAQPMSNEELLIELSKERNLSFHSVGELATASKKNTIRAVIHDDCTITSGMDEKKSVRLRTDEAMNVGGVIIPRNTVIAGTASIGQRLEIIITSVEYEGKIFETAISVYDMDGQRGINVPGSTEINAAKEIAANAGSGMGSSFNITSSAGQQIASDLSRSAIQGTSQYISGKMRQVKIHLKAGYRLLLLPETN
jgi:conjugative transposon TraM protein